MAGGIRSYSTTPGSNNASPPYGWPEGQPPSSVNNAARQMMADIRAAFEELPWFDFGDVPTRVDNDTITVPTDLTARYVAGRRIKIVGATTGYATISSVSYSAPDTTINVTMDSGNVPTSLVTVSLGPEISTGAAVPYFARTAAEIAAGVTPVTYSFVPGDVRRYGAVGDGATDETTAFANALLANAGAVIFVPPPATAYKINSGLTIPTDTAVVGYNKRLCKILCGANIDLITLNAGAQLYGLYLEGNATTGHGIVIPAGLGNQSIAHVRAINFDVGTGGGVLHYADQTAGSRMSVHDFEVSQTNGTSGSDKYAVYVPDTFSSLAVPRKFSHVETGGLCSFFFGGCNDFFITGSFLADCKFSANSRAVQIQATRIANQVALTVNGANHSILGIDINPQIILPSTLTNSAIGPGSLNAGLATNNTITAITQANPAVVTISTGGASNPFLVGQTLHVDSVVGMTQINDVESVVTAIGGSTGAWTITLTVDSSAFTAYTSGGFLTKPAIIDNTGGNNYVQVFQGRQLYNPTISNSGANFVLGNGTCLGYYSMAGSLIWFEINFTLGSTTTIGTTELRFRLPRGQKLDGEVVIAGGALLTIGAQQYTALSQIPGNVAYARLIWSRNDGANSGTVTGTSPGALAAGDIIRVSGSYVR